MALGKSMGGGVMPIGALLGTEASMDFDDVSTGSTWSWLPAACAAALATLDVFEREPVLENVMALEAAGLDGLRALAERYEAIGDVRAVGCFMAIEFVKDRETKERDLELQERVGVGVRAARAAARSVDDVAQHPAVAHDAGRRHGHGARHPRRGDRRGLARRSARVNDDEARAWVGAGAARPRRDLLAVGEGTRRGRPPRGSLRGVGPAGHAHAGRRRRGRPADRMVRRPVAAAHGAHRHRDADVVVGSRARRRRRARPRGRRLQGLGDRVRARACCSRASADVDLEALPVALGVCATRSCSVGAPS